MVKSDLIRVISEKNELSIPETERVVEAFFDAMISAFKEGRRVELRGFGSFVVREYDGYMGRNPRTGDAVSVPPKRMPFFKVGKGMREVVNG